MTISQPSHWVRTGNILAFPHRWQTPAKTEQWAYDACRESPLGGHYFELVCFPWATLIDLLQCGMTQKADALLEVLRATPPRRTLVRATVCQHIYAKHMLEWFARLKITDLYWPHATASETQIQGIRIHPFPLYPVRGLDASQDDESPPKPLEQRRYLYSFIGAYQPEFYLTAARPWIFALPARNDAYVERRDAWHYQHHVYGEQVGGTPLGEAERSQHLRHGREYVSVLADSLFSLCPSGSGPNSIRLWESLGLGCIPVLLSDDLRLPGDQGDWDAAVIRVPESQSALEQLPRQLERLAKDRHRLEKRRQACQRLWQKYGLNGPSTILGELTRTDWVYAQVSAQACEQEGAG